MKKILGDQISAKMGQNQELGPKLSFFAISSSWFVSFPVNCIGQ